MSSHWSLIVIIELTKQKSRPKPRANFSIRNQLKPSITKCSTTSAEPSTCVEEDTNQPKQNAHKEPNQHTNSTTNKQAVANRRNSTQQIEANWPKISSTIIILLSRPKHVGPRYLVHEAPTFPQTKLLRLDAHLPNIA